MSLPASPFAGELVVFSGPLGSMTHAQAQERVVAQGGTAADQVTRQTTLVVIGEQRWLLESDGTLPLKLQQAQKWIDAGRTIRIIREGEWLRIVDPQARGTEPRVYTPAMLSQLLGVSRPVLRMWERRGLIQPVRRIGRLSYFDFEEVTAVRHLTELRASGVSAAEIAAGLKNLQRLLPDVERPLAQLEMLTDEKHWVVRDDAGLLVAKTGQRVFDFDAGDAADAVPLRLDDRWTSDDWLAEAGRRLQDDDLAAAVEALRLALLEAPQRADLHFQLAEVLSRQGNQAGALERYHMAVELDGQYVEAWTQLGCVYATAGLPDQARHAFDIALDLHPDLPEAHWHLAALLEEQGDPAAARPHWEAYLQHDDRGPWAEEARRRLECDVERTS